MLASGNLLEKNVIMKIWIKIIIYTVVATVIATLPAVTVGQARHINSLKAHVDEQHTIIDSLLKRRMTVIDCQLHVTDKSRFAIYGRYNKGTINVPNDRTYTLQIDSTNITVK